jgi:hypothetical protein
MARIRTIKPEFFTSEDIVELSAFARLLYISTWCEADREGRLTWKPKTFKLRYFPADNVDIDALCNELIERKLIVLYGDGLAYIPSFSKHQHINPREARSELPEPTQQKARVDDASARVSDTQVGRERKGNINDASADAPFDAFWTAYPKKKSRGDAEKAWDKLNPDERLVDQILQAVQRAKTSDQWQKEGGQFIPYPATWLRDKGWLDEITPRLAAVGGAVDPRFKGAK